MDERESLDNIQPDPEREAADALLAQRLAAIDRRFSRRAAFSAFWRIGGWATNFALGSSALYVGLNVLGVFKYSQQEQEINQPPTKMSAEEFFAIAFRNGDKADLSETRHGFTPYHRLLVTGLPVKFIKQEDFDPTIEVNMGGIYEAVDPDHPQRSVSNIQDIGDIYYAITKSDLITNDLNPGPDIHRVNVEMYPFQDNDGSRGFWVTATYNDAGQLIAK